MKKLHFKLAFLVIIISCGGFILPDFSPISKPNVFNIGEFRKMGLDSISFNKADSMIKRFNLTYPNNQRNGWFVSRSFFNWLGQNDGFNHYFTTENDQIKYVFSPSRLTHTEIVNGMLIETLSDNRSIFMLPNEHLTAKFILPESQAIYNVTKQNMLTFQNSFSAQTFQSKSAFIGRTALYDIVYGSVPNKIGWMLYIGLDTTNKRHFIVVGANKEKPTSFAEFANATYIGTTKSLPSQLPPGTVGNGASCVKPCPDACGDF